MKLASSLPNREIAAVLVTGGSSGIGAALIAHLSAWPSRPWVGNLSRSVPSPFSNIPVTHYPVDLTNSVALAEVAGRLPSEVDAAAPKGPVVLINNSGFGSYGDFMEQPLERQLAMIDLNVRAVVDLSGRLLPWLRQRGPGSGLINIASTASFQGCPSMATYAATKAFLRSWSLAIDAELRPHGLRSLCVCPGPTKTNFFQASAFQGGQELPGQRTAEAVAADTWNAWQQGRSLAICGPANRLATGAVSLLPSSWAARLAGLVLSKVRPSGK